MPSALLFAPAFLLAAAMSSAAGVDFVRASVALRAAAFMLLRGAVREFVTRTSRSVGRGGTRVGQIHECVGLRGGEAPFFARGRAHM